MTNEHKKYISSRRNFVKQTGVAAGGMLAMPILSKLNFLENIAKNNTTKITECTEAAWLPYNPTNNLTQAGPFTVGHDGDNGNWLYYYKTPQTAIKEWLDVEYADEDLCSNTQDLCTIEGDENALKELKYKVSYPLNYPYSNCTAKPPAVFLFHPGGFSDCTGIEQANFVDQIADQMVSQGFLVFNVEYRRGRATSTRARGLYPDYFGNLKKVYYTTSSQDLCYYRAFQDVRGAIRTIITRNRAVGGTYKFDENNIFLGGFSAGAICAVNAAFYTPAMVYAVSNGAEAILGPIDADYYDCDPNLEYQSKIKAVSNCWGNAFIPKDVAVNLTPFFPPVLRKPLISFHGMQDWDVCPYSSQPVFFSETGQFSDADGDGNTVSENPENRCLPDGRTFDMDYGSASDLDMYRFGSYKMYCFLKSVNVFTELYADPDMIHGINDADDDFGIGTTHTTPDKYTYIGYRIATFFQAVLNTDPNFLITLKTMRSYFENCANGRYGNNTADNNYCSGTTLNPCN